MIKGFVFDLDGVITDTAILHFEAWQAKVKELGIDYSFEENEKLRGLPRLDTLKAIINLKNPSLKVQEEKLIELCDAKNVLYKQLLEQKINKDSILPNIAKFLEDAKAKGIKLAIASSSYNAPLILEKLGLKDAFDYIVYPGDVKNGKPAPDIFILAAQGLGLSTNECVGFEDATAGIDGIVDANMHSVAITNGNNEDYSKADLILNSTNELDCAKILTFFNNKDK
ncbi:beta-phosphoglucomutase [Mycoplasma sp. NEAQ87857]|uniref:beta-phosphoglucomutase n=1 Tax=Mycoplasma sp. NEAQ87857 TaxID=2683967 RepID=UPI0013189D6C|nr:beta-phosphoglucomutase [Mycoplasma sp. NEAQ87857]QGZ97218.1 beta-phosphoglucomutase [Mycoplasma sp. NEAQ87857]